MKRVISVFLVISVLLLSGCEKDSASYFTDLIEDYAKYYATQDVKSMRYESGDKVRIAYNETLSLMENEVFHIYGVFPRLTRFSIFAKFADTKLILSKFEVILSFYDRSQNFLKRKHIVLQDIPASEIKELKFNKVNDAYFMQISSVNVELSDPNNLMMIEKERELPASISTGYCKVCVDAESNNHISIDASIDKNYCVTVSLLNRHFKEIEQYTFDENSKKSIDDYIDFGAKYCTVIVTSQKGGKNGDR